MLGVRYYAAIDTQIGRGNTHLSYLSINKHVVFASNNVVSPMKLDSVHPEMLRSVTK